MYEMNHHFSHAARFLAALLAAALLAMGFTGCSGGLFHDDFRLLASMENRDLEALLQKEASKAGIKLQIDYAETMDLMSQLNSADCPYDGAWLSNSIWLYQLDGTQKVINAKATSINPVVFGITESKAQELGFVGRDVAMGDLVEAVRSGALTFLMPSATQTNTGASAYLGFLSTLAGSPEVLTEQMLESDGLKSELISLFQGVARSSGSEEYLGQLFQSGGYNALVDYEFSLIRLNQQRTASGQEPLYLIYPVDGVSFADAPFAYIDHGDAKKLEQFQSLQNFLLSMETQRAMAETGRRTGYGGLNPFGSEEVFNPAWGIDLHRYLSPVKYPSTSVIRAAFNLYQTELKKPSITVFCLDYSGSMYGEGEEQLRDAMDYLLTPEKASRDFIQFGEKDVILLFPFSREVLDAAAGTGAEWEELLRKLDGYEPGGGTDIYAPLLKALDSLKDADADRYSISLVLMTDGQTNVNRLKDLTNAYRNLGKDIGIYAVTFGEASTKELSEVVKLSNGKVFDGKTDLVKAFKTVRGYN